MNFQGRGIFIFISKVEQKREKYSKRRKNSTQLEVLEPSNWTFLVVETKKMEETWKPKWSRSPYFAIFTHQSFLFSLLHIWPKSFPLLLVCIIEFWFNSYSPNFPI